MRRLIRLNPATSTIEGMNVMSLVPAYALTSPPPTVEATSFGTPTGSVRIAVVAIDVPPLPPIDTMPSRRPWSYSRRTTTASPAAMPAIASSLCSPDRHRSRSPPPATATSARPTSGVKAGSPSTPKSTVSTSSPVRWITCLT